MISVLSGSISTLLGTPEKKRRLRNETEAANEVCQIVGQSMVKMPAVNRVIKRPQTAPPTATYRPWIKSVRFKVNSFEYFIELFAV